jgi:type IV pilus assembly protein PilB
MAALLGALVKQGLITEEQLKEAKEKQVGAKRPVQELLVEMGFISEEDLTRASSGVFNIPVANLSEEPVDDSLTKVISYEIARRYGVFPLRKENGALLLAMSDPVDVMAMDAVRNIVNTDIKAVLSTKSAITANIEKYYHLDDSLYDLLKNIVDEAGVKVVKLMKEGGEVVDIAGHAGSEAAIIRLVNLILSDAVAERASDIHIEPQENIVAVRYRVDGDLRNIMKIPKTMHSHLVARIKILAQLDIAENKKPQDGRIRISVGAREVDLRISVIPAHYGEKVALRLLDAKTAKIQIESLGFEDFESDIFREAINRPQGMILISGPTGSGKTSTIYSALNYIKAKNNNIVTIEDPIEYLIEGINQMQVNPIKDVTFANALRSILRQDPDVILVGEIRDKESAEIAFRSSLTGHLVFTTLHTNSAVSCITRLLDIGLEPYLISSSVILIAAQRLIKLICPHCRQEYAPEADLLNKLKIYLEEYKISRFYKGQGCAECGYTGFLGRAAIFELLQVNQEIQDLIAAGAAENEIFKQARRFGFKTLVESGIQKAAKGLTTIEEVAGKVEFTPGKLPPQPTVGQSRPRILIADDDRLIRKMVISAFDIEKDKFEFIEAQNGEEALRYVRSMKPDLLITDVLMPEMDGIQLTKSLRSRLESASIPIIMLTSQKEKENEIEGLDAGADDYITKPFDKDRLLMRAKILLRRAGLQSA